MHVILGFKPISTRFQVSKHVIKTKDQRLALVDVAVEGFIQKPPPVGTQLMELPTLTETQHLVEEVISSDNVVKAQSKEIEEEFEEESIESLLHDEDFEIFYHWDSTEDIVSTSKFECDKAQKSAEASIKSSERLA